MRVFIAGVTLIICAACGTPTEPHPPLLQGWWVSPIGWGLLVERSSVSVAAGCRFGHMPIPTSNRTSDFKVIGDFGGSGGPPTPGYQLPSAIYEGHIDNETLSLVVRPANSEPLGPITFQFRGSDPRGVASPCP